MRYPTQDPKYDIEVTRSGAHLVNSATGQPIPRNMPIFVFLGKDKRAVNALFSYRNDCMDDAHIAAVNARIEEFEQYARTHSGEMKEPDTGQRYGKGLHDGMSKARWQIVKLCAGIALGTLIYNVAKVALSRY